MSQSIKKITLVSSIPLLAIALVAIVSSVQANAIATSVNSTIGSIISVFTSSGTVAVNATPTAGGVQTINNDIITVSTNDAAGYTLKINETGASGTLVSGGNSIAASSGTFASPIAQAANTWGYRVDSAGTFGAGPTSSATNAAISGTIKFAAVPVTASPDTIKTTATTASNDTTNVWYGVAVNTSTPSGSYTNSVTYTAVAN
ncbi:MAG TPA: hypothetical protein VIM31_00810 [Candidatus Microsaccharimonas sp.]|jgi:hypothetical protein